MFRRDKSRLSPSALLVSKGLVLVSRDRKLHALVPKEAAELSLGFIRGISGNRMFVSCLGFPLYRFLIGRLVRLAYPGLILNYALRKRIIEDAALAHIQNGATQLVVIGAGLDTLAFRLAKQFPKVVCFEIDKEQTQSVKRALLKKSGAEEAFVFIGADLSKTRLQDVLLAHPKFDREAVTVFILEAVTMYLSADTVADLFQQIKNLAAPKSLFAFTFMDSRGKDRLISRWWQKNNEKLTFSLPPDEIKSFVERFNMKLSSLHLFHEIQKPYVSERECALLQKTRGEHVCITAIAE